MNRLSQSLLAGSLTLALPLNLALAQAPGGADAKATAGTAGSAPAKTAAVTADQGQGPAATQDNAAPPPAAPAAEPPAATVEQRSPSESRIERRFQEESGVEEVADPDVAHARAVMGEAIDQAIDQATDQAFDEAFDGKSDDGGNKAVDEAVDQAIDLAITEAIDDAIDEATSLPLQGPPYHSPSTIHNGVTAFRNHRITSGLGGATGLLRTDSAILGQNGLTRISLAGAFVVEDDFPTRGTQLTHAGAQLALDLVFLKYFEGFLSYGIASDFADDGETTALRQTLGDFQFGVKGSSQIFQGFYLGGALHFGLAPGFGADWDAGVSFNFAPHLIASWDARSVNGDVPLILHLNLGAIFTNQDRIYDDYAPSSFDEFAFDLNRYNRLSIAFGLEIPLPWVTPFIEWNMALPMTSSDLYSPEGRPVDAASAMAHHLALGLKVTALPDITFMLGFELGLNGEVARGVSPTPGAAFVVGLSYAFDPLANHRDAADPDDAQQRLLVPPPAPAPAIEEEAPAAAPVEVPVEAEGAAVEAAPSAEPPAAPAIAPTAPAAAVVPAPPAVPDAAEAGDDDQPRLFLMGGGKPRAGQVLFADGQQPPLEVAADGLALDLAPGTYKVVVLAEGFLAKAETLEVDGEGIRIDLRLTAPRPAKALVSVGADKLELSAQPAFVGQSSRLLGTSGGLLDQIADLLLSNKVARLRIEGHTDNRGVATRNLALSKARAESVRQALIERGVDKSRLVAEGKGGAMPIASNALSKGRERNRRIELLILR